MVGQSGARKVKDIAVKDKGISYSTSLRTVRDFDLTGKRIILRADFNVPLDKEGNITDDFRIRQAVPTIEYILGKMPRQLIIMSHLGRPDGKVVEELRLDNVARRLSELLSMPVKKSDDCVTDIPSDCIVLLENLRFHKEEEANDEGFARKLASYADIYVDDAMGTAHRAHASTVGITRFLPSCAGLLLEKEVAYLSKLKNPKRPFIAIIGGAKISEKIGVMKTFAEKADLILVGGAIANTFLIAAGYKLASSRFEPEQLDFAKSLLLQKSEVKFGRQEFHKITIPVDLVAGKIGQSGTKGVDILKGEAVPEGLMALDIGPQTIALFSKAIRLAKCIVWSGPMGFFEDQQFSKGTNLIAGALASSSAETIVGGGDTNDALKKSGFWDKMSFVSTAGSAMLEFIEKGDLPAIKVLRKGQ